jgi:hypothetical protein
MPDDNVDRALVAATAAKAAEPSVPVSKLPFADRYLVSAAFRALYHLVVSAPGGMVDAQRLGRCVFGRGGSSPPARTDVKSRDVLDACRRTSRTG